MARFGVLASALALLAAPLMAIAQTADFEAKPELVSFARNVGPMTASAPGPKADRYLLFAYDAATDQFVIHSMGVLVPGGALPPVAPPTVAVLRTSRSKPSRTDANYAAAAGAPLFLVGNGGQMWEVGRRQGQMMLRAIAPRETPWKPLD